MTNFKIGFLPLYLELYDKAAPGRRDEIEAFKSTIEAELKQKGLHIVTVPTCRIHVEFAKAIELFEQENVDAIVTLHLAYSPSLESIEVLAATKLPIIVMDTTPDYEFGMSIDPNRLMLNHGIHGVQDMCNLLIRHNKPFIIEAGHWQQSDILDRVVTAIKAAKLATGLRTSRVGLIGEQFKGMGDFAVPFDTLTEALGIEVIQADNDNLQSIASEITQDYVQQKIAENYATLANDISQEVLQNSVYSSLVVKRWLKKEKLTAFSQNFLHFDGNGPIPTVPFLECSKSMTRGIGYAGEGDVLTAALVGALLSVFKETTFTEMFCPDWKENRIFMSHMGEANVDLLDDLDIIEYDFIYSAAPNPAKFAGRLKPGPATLVNLAPGPDNTYSLITSELEICDAPNGDSFKHAMRGWLKPQRPLQDFLAEYSRNGGTHHKALIYGHQNDILAKFATLMNWKYVKI